MRSCLLLSRASARSRASTLQLDEEKVDTYIDRRKEDVKLAASISAELAGGSDKPLPHRLFNPYGSCSRWVYQAFQHHGIKVKWSDRDADCELAYLAAEDGCGGVITGDSDLLFFRGVKRVFLADSLRFPPKGSGQRIRAKVVDVDRVLKAAGLVWEQWSRLPALLGKGLGI